MNITTILDLIAEREAAASQSARHLREQIAQLTADLAQVDRELADLATTRTTLRAIAAAEFTTDDPKIASAPTSRSWPSWPPRPPPCAPGTSAWRSRSTPLRSTSKAPARSSSAWSPGAS